MKFTHSTCAIILAAFSALGEGHMLLQSPMRFPAETNAPLITANQTGASNYPCQLTTPSVTYAFTGSRHALPLGSNQTLSFLGESVHGGGSCQLSLTKDLEPDASSVFKVIHTIQGGCPARDTPGNLGADNSATQPDPFTYDYTIPSDLEPGDYTFAWTWFNKIGNREMYMGCSPVTITGSGSQKRDASSSSSDAYFNSLPNMFLANLVTDPIKGNCASPPDGTDMVFPDPGKNMEIIHNTAGDHFAPPVMLNGVSCYAPIGSKATSSNQDSSNSFDAGSSSGSNSSSSSEGSSTSSSATSSPDTVSSTAPLQITTPSTGSGAGSDTTGTNTGSSSGSSSSDTSSSSGSSSGSGSGSLCPGGTVSCSSPGSLICISATQFGICNQENCAVPQAVATGTQCQGGQISRRGLRVPPQARHRRHFSVSRHGWRFNM